MVLHCCCFLPASLCEFDEKFKIGSQFTGFSNLLQACVHSLTKEEASTGPEKDEIRLDVEQTMKFIDLARQMETFFIQKRFLLSSLKPELLLKEENVDLRHEISRKDELIRKHFEKIERWKQLLADQQQPVSKQILTEFSYKRLKLY